MTGDNWVSVVGLICFFGWIPLLALGKGISFIVKAWRD